MKIAIVFGTRPEAIKMCPVVIELRKRGIECVVCLTGQHREMLNQVINSFHIDVDYNLDVMSSKQSLQDITIAVMRGMEKIIRNERPDIVLVHGDTTTSYAAAVLCFYERIPLGHVEAGLRTYDMLSPFPEEFNRQSVDMISSVLFAPTENARRNLIKEGIKEKNIYVTGNTVIDALKTTVKDDYSDENLKWAEGSRLILLTAHRRENWGKPMEGIFLAVKKIVEEYDDVKIIYPVHKNPIVSNMAFKMLSDNDRIRLIEPLDVIAFHNYMSRSYLILTDSGGIQEEAPSLGVPVLVMREHTERPEGITAGTVRLAGTQSQSIYENTKRLLDDKDLYNNMSTAVNPYGDGHSSERIADILIKYLGG